MKDNKLLAEYLNQLYYPFEWHPDKDWNQLMMVVEKIEKENLDRGMDILISCKDKSRRVDTVPYSCGIFNIMGNGDSKIEAVYNACVEYIKSK